jgi:hypothetical protein
VQIRVLLKYGLVAILEVDEPDTAPATSEKPATTEVPL